MVNLVDEGIDAAVRIGVLEDSTLVARNIGATRRVCVASPKYLSRRKKLREAAELSEHALIQFTGLSATPEWRFVRNGQEQRIAFAPRLVTNSVDAALGHALRGGGLCLALAYQCVDAVRAGELRVVLADHEPPAVPIHVVYPTSRLLSAKVRAFVELIQKADFRFVDL